MLLGSNLGDRMQVMHTAIEYIREDIGRVNTISSVYETTPWGVLDQPAFLNQVVEVETYLGPEDVLRIILGIEHELGRERHQRWGARVIDIDLLYFNDLILDSARLTVPHPRLHERRFTMVPLAEIAPEFVHPVFRKSTLQLLADCTDIGGVNIVS